ncbi:hypothetical protein [Brevibacillus fulvus]|uniref:Uncharacterized protein n=1 Tax=Brevibacillus fulvus TaxID=1125967 RepID=A0A938Y145_9BACL|nr:hypothetical protein [Brevibacillus fulvus]MBM7589662.1 hypothetical protein [Brevibacillus fulvus]
MQSVARDSLYLSMPVTHRQYVAERSLNSYEYKLYQHIRTLYGFDPGNHEPSLAPVFFHDEPCLLAEALYEKTQFSTKVDYLLCCYKTYQLTKKVSAPLAILKSLGLKNVQAFALHNIGVLSPLMAIEWTLATDSTALVVCLEQIYDYQESQTAGYPKADALAMFQLSSAPGPLEICGYDWTLFPGLPGEDDERQLSALTCQLIEQQLQQSRLDRKEITIIAHLHSDAFLYALQRQFPHVYVRADRYNLLTADPFYSLEEYYGQEKKDKEYILLTFADQAAGVGCILLRDCAVERRETR